jgi:hypothetical protein
MKKLVTLVVLLAIPAFASAVTVEGKNYPPKITVEGVTLKLIGAGLREKWMFDVYAMGAYTASGDCGTKKIVEADEVKYIRLDMLRDVSAEKMRDAIAESFDKNMPANASKELKEQRKTFFGYFKNEMTEGTKLEFTYVPGTGVTAKQNGKSLGAPLAGVEFQKVFWSIYFGPKTCCEDLREQVLSVCAK